MIPELVIWGRQFFESTPPANATASAQIDPRVWAAWDKCQRTLGKDGGMWAGVVQCLALAKVQNSRIYWVDYDSESERWAYRSDTCRRRRRAKLMECWSQVECDGGVGPNCEPKRAVAAFVFAFIGSSLCRDKLCPRGCLRAQGQQIAQPNQSEASSLKIFQVLHRILVLNHLLRHRRSQLCLSSTSPNLVVVNMTLHSACPQPAVLTPYYVMRLALSKSTCGPQSTGAPWEWQVRPVSNTRMPSAPGIPRAHLASSGAPAIFTGASGVIEVHLQSTGAPWEWQVRPVSNKRMPGAPENPQVHLGNLQVRLASPGAPDISRCTWCVRYKSRRA
jgi:hypothetical protein